MPLAWILVLVAVAANVSLNLCLKQVSRQLDPGLDPLSLALRVLGAPWIWLGGVSAVLLVGCFVLSLRMLPLSVSYTAVTALAMVSLTVLGAMTGTEAVGLMRAAGLTVVIAGLAIMAAST